VRKLITPKTVFALRWFLTVLAVLSLFAWLWSWWWWLSVAMRSNDLLGVARGCLALVINHDAPWADLVREPTVWFGVAPEYLPVLPFGSLEWREPLSGATSIHVPLWVLAMAFGAPAAWLWVNRRKLRPTDCKRCGYDLRGLAGNKCPECGSPRGDQATPAAGEA